MNKERANPSRFVPEPEAGSAMPARDFQVYFMPVVTIVENPTLPMQ